MQCKKKNWLVQRGEKPQGGWRWLKCAPEPCLALAEPPDLFYLKKKYKGMLGLFTGETRAGTEKHPRMEKPWSPFRPATGSNELPRSARGTRLATPQPPRTPGSCVAASQLFPLQYAGLSECFLREKAICLLCFNPITMSNSFLLLCSGLEKASIISTVARRLLPGHKILIRNNHAALKWELRAAKKVKPSIKYSMAAMYY